MRSVRKAKGAEGFPPAVTTGRVPAGPPSTSSSHRRLGGQEAGTCEIEIENLILINERNSRINGGQNLTLNSINQNKFFVVKKVS